MERFIATNATPQKKEATRREDPETPPDSPALDLSDAAVKKLIRTAKKRGYGSRASRAFLRQAALKRFPADLNRWDSQRVMDERVFGH